MRKPLVPVLLAALGAFVVVGCNSENLVPYFSRVDSSEDCGVAPLPVQFVARASGGDDLDDFTGANDYLEISWDFRDGDTASGSLVYHTFEDPGHYDVMVTVSDKDGEGETVYLPVEVLADSLTVVTVPGGNGAEPDTTVASGQSLPFTVFASSCDFQAEADDAAYDLRFVFTWLMDDMAQTVYRVRSPSHAFALADTGLRHVVLTILDPQRSLTRRDTVTVLVTP